MHAKADLCEIREQCEKPSARLNRGLHGLALLLRTHFPRSRPRDGGVRDIRAAKSRSVRQHWARRTLTGQ
jgi:hypothetical protein